MAAKSKKKQQPKGGSEIFENPDALAEKISKTEEFFEKNKMLVTIAFIAVVVVVGGLIGWRYYMSATNERALSEMYQAEYYFQQDSLNLALRGDGNNLGFVEIADRYASTKAGNLANFYAGAIYVKQGKYDLAVYALEDFESDDLLIQARAYSLLGDVYMEQSQFEQAADYYNRASNYKPNKEFTPVYLRKAAIAFEKSGQVEEAKSAYKRIIDEYWESSEYQDARKHFARLGGKES